MFNITLETDWGNKNGKGVSLLPEPATITIETPISYDSACRFDYDRAIDEAEAQLYQAWGFRLDLRATTTTEGSFEDSLKRIMVENLIRQEPDVLGDFSLDSSGLGRDGEGLSLPLIMGGSNYRFSVACTLGFEGKPDGKAIVEALAQAYCEVFQLPSGEGVFRAGQQADLEQRAADWAQGLMAEAGLALPKVEVNLESHAWVGNSLRLYVDVYNHAKVQYDLLLPVSDKGELDYSGIEQAAAQIAQEMSQRLGLGSPEWLARHIAQQIEPDAKEYAAWIIEVENNIRAEFWEGVNREMAGHLKKAEDLHEKAKKWRHDYDKWLKESGNISISVEGSVGAGGEFAVTIPKLPEEQKNTFELIWEGLGKLPGAVYRGVRPHAGEMWEGLKFGFLAAGVVIKKSAYLILQDVIGAIDSGAWECINILLEKPLERKIGERKAFLSLVGSSVFSFVYGRYETRMKIEKRFYELQNLAIEINDKIIETKNKLYSPAGVDK